MVELRLKAPDLDSVMEITALKIACRHVEMEHGGTRKQMMLAKRLPDYWALYPTTGLSTRLLGFASDYWAFIRISIL